MQGQKIAERLKQNFEHTASSSANWDCYKKHKPHIQLELSWLSYEQCCHLIVIPKQGQDTRPVILGGN